MEAFERKWNAAGLDDGDLQGLQMALLMDPKAGVVIRGATPLRKVRWARAGMGRSGGVRVFYVDFPVLGHLFLLAILQKNQSDNFSEAERKALGSQIAGIEKDLRTRLETERKSYANKRK
jgi:hypothetical protein